MCGYVFSVSSNRVNAKGALALMQHRGPDAFHVVEKKIDKKNVTLGHVRLSIHDLTDAGDQPFLSQCGRFALVFNGEIYNYQELKDRLLPGVALRTASDTEVLLELLMIYGKKILNNLDGMFSFVFVDLMSGEGIIVRDQLGIKPCYFTTAAEDIFVASEIKSLFALSELSPEVSPQALYEFMRNSFVYEPQTGFKDIHKLMSGCLISFQVGKQGFEVDMYWHPNNKALTEKYQVYSEPKRMLADEIKRSCRLQQSSDVPIGLFFSGGVDSTILMTNLVAEKNIDILSVKTEASQLRRAGVTDDYSYAKKISAYLGKPIKPIVFEPALSSELFLLEVERCALGVEELVADFTYSISRGLSVQARRNKSIVMLSGLGADEIFAGYEKYRLIIHRRLYSLMTIIAMPFLKKSRAFSKKVTRLEGFLNSRSFVDGYSNMLGYFSGKEVDELLLSEKDEEIQYLAKLNGFLGSANNDLQRAMLLDHRGFLQHNFTVADKSSMSASIELRVPLATKALMEYSFGEHPKSLIDFRQTKKTLRALLKGLVPDKYMKRKKAGFHPPMDDVIFSLGRGRVYNILNEHLIDRYLSKKVVEEILDDHYSMSKNNTYKIFQLLYFSYWYKGFFEVSENEEK